MEPERLTRRDWTRRWLYVPSPVTPLELIDGLKDADFALQSTEKPITIKTRLEDVLRVIGMP